MTRKLNILILIKPFWKLVKHKPKYDMIKALEQHANVMYSYENGHINEILKSLTKKPDFIFHYDIAWENALAPNITGLAECTIPKGCFVIDIHWSPKARTRYIDSSKIDMIFSVSKHPFLNTFPQYKEKMHWLPWSINPTIYKNWNLEKDVNYLLMGLVYIEAANEENLGQPKSLPPKGRYKFREEVLQKLKNKPGFVFHPHPGHRVKNSHSIVQEKYAQELNRSKIFFTCGSRNKLGSYPVLKFFEAPACNTLLLAEPNEDIEALGFRDGVNYVSCTTDQIVEKATYYLVHDQKRERITKNGHQFIHENHTDDHRAEQMIEYIETFIRNKNEK